MGNNTLEKDLLALRTTFNLTHSNPRLLYFCAPGTQLSQIGTNALMNNDIMIWVRTLEGGTWVGNFMILISLQQGGSSSI